MLLLSLCPAVAATSADAAELLCILVPEAQIARHRPAAEGRYGRANSGHQIGAGKASVLAFRVYQHRDGPPDSQLFKKATLQIALPSHIPAGKEVSIGVVRSAYSAGASAWVVEGGYAWTVDPFARVFLRRDGEGLHARLKASIETRSASRFAKHQNGERVAVEFACPLRLQSLKELTPWTGKAGTSSAAFYGP